MDVKTAKHLLRKEVIDLRIGYICTKEAKNDGHNIREVDKSNKYRGRNLKKVWGGKRTTNNAPRGPEREKKGRGGSHAKRGI